jgi:hypothetical protein
VRLRCVPQYNPAAPVLCNYTTHFRTPNATLECCHAKRRPTKRPLHSKDPAECGTNDWEGNLSALSAQIPCTLVCRASFCKRTRARLLCVQPCGTRPSHLRFRKGTELNSANIQPAPTLPRCAGSRDKDGNYPEPSSNRLRALTLRTTAQARGAWWRAPRAVVVGELIKLRPRVLKDKLDLLHPRTTGSQERGRGRACVRRSHRVLPRQHNDGVEAGGTKHEG